MVQARSGTPSRAGFTLLEVLITMVIVGLTAGAMALLQRSTWGSTRSTNNGMLASQLIERQVEQMRMDIAIDSTHYWPPKDSTFIDPESRISLRWHVDTVHDPADAVVQRYHKILFMATWISTRPESLSVTAALSHDF